MDTRKSKLYNNLYKKYDFNIFNTTEIDLATKEELIKLKNSNSGVILMDRTLNGTPETIKTNLKLMADKFEDFGFKKWNLILDPGIGFGKIGN